MAQQQKTWLATAVLLLAYFFALTSSLRHKTPTFDEQGFIVRGVAYLRGENQHMRVGHPLGLNALNAALLAADPAIALPTADPSWRETSFHRPGELFMWEIGNDVTRIMLLSRLPSLWLGLLLLAVVGRWAQEMTRWRPAGLLALALLALDPNFLAHTRLATTDLGLAAGVGFAGYALWRYGQRPSWANLFLFAAAFAFMINTKFTAGLFAFLMGLILLAFWGLWGKRPFAPRRGVMTMQIFLVFPLAVFLLLWASYGFQVGTMPLELPTLAQLGGLTLPLSHYLEQLLDIGGRLQTTTSSFLLGEHSQSGWWYYFPVAFLLKTPLPTLILLTAALVLFARLMLSGLWKRWPLTIDHWQLTIFLLPLGYFAFALTTDINLGYRHLLPVLPFTAVFIAVVYHEWWARNGRWRRFAAYGSWVLVGWLGLNTAIIYPHFLTFFNGLAGGAENGWRYLVDSNIDWGQDLAGLPSWMAENGVDQVWLSYFGEGRPDYYGIAYRGLDSWPPRFTHPETLPFYPPDPAPGIYAISVTNLQGVPFANHDQYAHFRQQEPLAKIGYSIFLYEVVPYGVPAELALTGVQVHELDPAHYALLETNQVMLRWFDAAQSWLILGGDNRWLAVGDTAVAAEWQPLLNAHYELAATTPAYRLYRQTSVAEAMLDLPAAPLAEFGSTPGQLSLWTAQMDEGPGLGLTTVWRVDKWEAAGGNGRYIPVNIFIHALDPNNPASPPVSQWDGQGARGDGWQPGDWLLHRHTLPAPPLADFNLWLGLYDPNTGQRWWTGANDQLQLEAWRSQ